MLASDTNFCASRVIYSIDHILEGSALDGRELRDVVLFTPGFHSVERVHSLDVVFCHLRVDRLVEC